MTVSAQEAQKRLDHFADQCRLNRLTATPQRLAVYRELARSCQHPSAESIHRQVRNLLPSLSLDTVYRTLRLFEKHGLIDRIGSDGVRARFDANTLQHYHFVCKICGLIGDVDGPRDEAFQAPPSAAKLGVIHSVHLEIRGICRNCATRASNKSRKGHFA